MPFPTRKLFAAIAVIATVLGGAVPAGAQSLNIVSGDGQIVLEQFRSTSPLVVQALDGDGQPVEGVEVDWAVTLGDGGLVSIEGVTDASGISSAFYLATYFQLGISIKSIEVTAASAYGSATFGLTASTIWLSNGYPAAPPLAWLLAPSLADPPFTGEVGSTLPGAVQILVTVQSGPQTGAPVPDVGVRIISAADINTSVPVSCAGPNGMAFTDETGLAVCDLVLGQETGKFRVAVYTGEISISSGFWVNIVESTTEPPEELQITSGPTLPSAEVGVAYATTLKATGGVPPYEFAIAGALPGGLALNGATGVISGTPTLATTAQFTATVTDSADETDSRVLSLTITADEPIPSTLTITSTLFPDGVVGEVYFASVSVAGGCISPFNPPDLSIISGELPPGLTLGSSTIQGTPTAAGNFQFTLQAQDACNAVAQRTFVVTISDDEEPPVTVINAAPDALTFAIDSGTDTAPGQAVALTATAVTDFTVAVATSSGGNWLQVNAAAGTTPFNLTAHVEGAAALVPGTYVGEITVVPDTAGAAPTRIPVNLVVSGPAEMVVSPSMIQFVMELGAPPPAQKAVTVSSSGEELPFQATAATDDGGSWLFATAVANMTPGIVFVAVNPIGLSEGTYEGTVTITRTDAVEESVSIPVTLQVPQPRPSVGAVTNAASFWVGTIAPGEMVTIFGTNLGPSELVPFEVTSANRLADELAQTRVLIDGLPSPILHTSEGQVSVIAPYAIAGQEQVIVEVIYKGLSSIDRDVQVTPAAPGIFVLDESGQGAILNQDQSVNGPENPAAIGTYISIFATGEGVVSPPVADGELVIVETIEDLPRPLLPVHVYIGAIEAEVSYAGAAPTLPAGMLQVNAKIPEGLVAGATLITIQVGDSASQNGVYVHIADAPAESQEALETP